MNALYRAPVEQQSMHGAAGHDRMDANAHNLPWGLSLEAASLPTSSEGEREVHQRIIIRGRGDPPRFNQSKTTSLNQIDRSTGGLVLSFIHPTTPNLSTRTHRPPFLGASEEEAVAVCERASPTTIWRFEIEIDLAAQPSD